MVAMHVAIADKSWIRVFDTPSCYGRAVPPSERIEAKDVCPSVSDPSGFGFMTRLIGQKFRAVCTARVEQVTADSEAALESDKHPFDSDSDH